MKDNNMLVWLEKDSSIRIFNVIKHNPMICNWRLLLTENGYTKIILREYEIQNRFYKTEEELGQLHSDVMADLLKGIFSGTQK